MGVGPPPPCSPMRHLHTHHRLNILLLLPSRKCREAPDPSGKVANRLTQAHMARDIHTHHHADLLLLLINLMAAKTAISVARSRRRRDGALTLTVASSSRT